jgi:hypothetical protein
MKRSTQVAAPLLAAAALAMATGCSKPEMQRCVDPQNTVVDNDLCQSPTEGRLRDGTLSPFRPSYRYYYGGTGTNKPGTPASNGTFAPLSGHSYKIATTATVRGGFGRSFAPWLVIGAGVAILLSFGAGQ